ncbi:MAG: phosphoribosyltransferase [Gemmatimonadota bacterium]
MKERFHDRIDAGRRLAEALVDDYGGRDDLLVLGLPRGGVPVAREVARALDAPLDIFLVRKLGVPGHPELAMGAIATGGVVVLNEDVVRMANVTEEDIGHVERQETEELRRREQAYRGDRAAPDLAGRTVLLVDDGLATGATMRAAALAVREQDPASVVVAVPVAAPETCASFRDLADDVVCARTPEPFQAVGRWYEFFDQTTDDEVRAILRQAREEEA